MQNIRSNATSGNWTSERTSPDGHHIDLSLEGYRIAAAVSGTMLNLVLFFLLVSDRKLCSGFNVYLVLIFTWDILHAVIVYPLRAIHSLLRSPWSSRICGTYLYFAWAGNGILLKFHTLITINRVWAVTFPVSYRNYHNTKMALFLCVAGFALENILFLPGFVINVERPRFFGISSHCAVVTEDIPAWLFCYVFVGYFVPALVITLGYVHILNKYCCKDKVTPKKVPVEKAKEANTWKRPSEEFRHGARYRSMALLTATSLSVYLAWMPTMILDFLTFFVLDYHEHFVFYAVRTVLGTIQPLLDPVLFLIGLVELRLALRLVLQKVLDKLAIGMRFLLKGR